MLQNLTPVNLSQSIQPDIRLKSLFFRILEDMREGAEDDDDDVDVGAFLEMLAAYLPGAEAIPEADIALWLRRVAKRSGVVWFRPTDQVNLVGRNALRRVFDHYSA